MSSTICYEDFAEMCINALNLLKTEDNLSRLNNQQTEEAMRRMLYYFESVEEYETCQDIQEIANVIFGHSIEPMHITYEIRQKSKAKSSD